MILYKLQLLYVVTTDTKILYIYLFCQATHIYYIISIYFIISLGRGTYYFVNGDVYVGEFENGIFHGPGVLRKANFREGKKDCIGRSYSGNWKNGSRSGKGKYHTGFGDFYDGEFLNDTYHGYGVMLYQNGDRYTGAWEKGKWHGEGEILFVNGNSYKGFFFKNMYHGEGMFRFGPSGGSYTGGWRLGMKHGIGKRNFASGAEYEGEYVDNEMCGKGIYKSAIGDLYVGTFKDSRFHGEGTLIKCTGDRYRGQFQKGLPTGIGRWDYERGGYYDGEFMAQVRTGIPYAPKPKFILSKFYNQDQELDDKDNNDKKKKNKKHTANSNTLSATNINKPIKKLKKLTNQNDENNDPISQMKLFKLNKQRKIQRKADEFTAPLLVGSPEDEAYLNAGGKSDGALALKADGKAHGKGIRVYADGSRYEGDWYQDMQHGFGVYIGSGPEGVRYEGTWYYGKRNGLGIQSYCNNDGNRYVCPLGNQHDGSARCFYDGHWKDGYFWGEGTFTCCDGRQYSGGWYKNKRHGIGRWVLLPAKLHYSIRRDATGSITSGQVANIGEYGQEVKFDDQYRIRVYEGEFNKNKRNGKGKITLNNGDVMEGKFLNGRLDGNVRITFNSSTGKVTYARYRHGTRYAWIGGKELEQLMKQEEEELIKLKNAEKKRIAAMGTLAKADMFAIKSDAKARAHGKILMDAERK